MIKHFCDCCGNEYKPNPGLTPAASVFNVGEHSKSLLGTAELKFRAQKDGTEVCLYCLIDAINTLDDRLSESEQNLVDYMLRDDPHKKTAKAVDRIKKELNGSGTG